MTFEVAEHSLKTALEAIYDNREAAAIAAMVMEFVTGKSSMDRWLIKHEFVSDVHAERLAQYTNELVTGKPVQYVIGEAWFALQQSIHIVLQHSSHPLFVYSQKRLHNNTQLFFAQMALIVMP